MRRVSSGTYVLIAGSALLGPVAVRDAFAQAAAAPLGEKIRALVAPLAQKKMFAGVVLVEQSDGTRSLELFGDADVESAVPVTAKTRFCIASVTKPMTQIVFARLIEEGKVRGEDPVAKYLPEFPRGPSGGEATVQMLLDHRAGVPHRVTKPFEEADRWTPQRIAARVAEAGLEFEPGSERRYTSAGYTCLARIAELVESKPFGNILQERVLAPAGMTDALDPAPREIIDRAARDYLPALGRDGRPALERAQPRDFSFLAGAGSVWATAEDLARFANALRKGKFGEEALDRSHALRSGSWQYWDGLTGGFASSVSIERSTGTVIVCLSNIRSGASQQLATRLRELVDKGTVGAVDPPPAPVDDLRLVSEVGGTYGLGDFLFPIEPHGAGVLIQDSVAYPIADAKLFWPYWFAELRPIRDQEARITAMEAVMFDRTMRYERK